MSVASFSLPTWVPTITSIAAFGLSSYSLWLQRRDKRPRLRVRIRYAAERTMIHADSDRGTAALSVADVLVIDLSNLGDRPIKIPYVLFKPFFKAAIQLPLRRTAADETIEVDTIRSFAVHVSDLDANRPANVRARRQLGRIIAVDQMDRAWASRPFFTHVPMPDRREFRVANRTGAPVRA